MNRVDIGENRWAVPIRFHCKTYLADPLHNAAPKRRNCMVASHGKPHLSIGLLDDDLSVLKATTRLLRSAGWEVEPFSDPAVFLRYVQRHCPPVVVIDIRMPVISGLEVQKRLHDVSPTTRVIVLTGSNNPSIHSQVMSVGASAFLLKPADDQEFLAEIESAAAIVTGDS